MINYCCFVIYWVNGIGRNPGAWRVQDGLTVLADYASLQGAKCAITRKWSRGE